PAVAHVDGVRGQPNAGVIQALAGAQVEALLEDGRGDLGDAGAIADDAARDHERARERVVVADRIDPLVVPLAVADTDDRDLDAPDQRGDAGVGRYVVDPADLDPGEGGRDRVGRRGLFDGGRFTRIGGHVVGHR